MGYTPCAHQPKRMHKLPTLQDYIDHVQQAREEAQIAICHAQKLMIKAKSRLQQYCPFTKGQKVWLKGKNLAIMHPTAKLATWQYSPFQITQVLSSIIY
jgi:hypothetical protein